MIERIPDRGLAIEMAQRVRHAQGADGAPPVPPSRPPRRRRRPPVSPPGWWAPPGRLAMVLPHADVAQLVEHHLAKVRVAGSNPVVRSIDNGTPGQARGLSFYLVFRVAGRSCRSARPSRAVGCRDGLYPPTLCPDCAHGPGAPATAATTGVTASQLMDEARHVEVFAFEAAVRLRNRFIVQDVWERLGADPK